MSPGDFELRRFFTVFYGFIASFLRAFFFESEFGFQLLAFETSSGSSLSPVVSNYGGLRVFTVFYGFITGFLRVFYGCFFESEFGFEPLLAFEPSWGSKLASKPAFEDSNRCRRFTVVLALHDPFSEPEVQTSTHDFAVVSCAVLRIYGRLARFCWL